MGGLVGSWGTPNMKCFGEKIQNMIVVTKINIELFFNVLNTSDIHSNNLNFSSSERA